MLLAAPAAKGFSSFFCFSSTADAKALSRARPSSRRSRIWNTAFTYKNKPIDTRQIGRELGVRYVLEGSVRRSGSRVRINAQLIDAETDAHLWAERCDCATADLFALQDNIMKMSSD